MSKRIEQETMQRLLEIKIHQKRKCILLFFVFLIAILCGMIHITNANSTDEDIPMLGKAASQEKFDGTSESVVDGLILKAAGSTIEHEEKDVVLTQVIADYLAMGSDTFENTYGRDSLFKEGFLYCDKEAWKYDGNQVDSYQEPGEYYSVVDITALRVVKEQPIPVYHGLNIGDELTEEAAERVTVELFDDYAVSVYAGEISGTFYVKEISFIKVDSCEEGASEALYQYLEDDYYRVRESLEDEKWIISPDGTKEACASEGMLTKHPSQIFIRYREVSAPDLIFRIAWACKVVGWIDDQYLVCDMVDIGPVLINLENHEVEQIKTPTDDYDGYGAQYVIDGGFLIASCMEEEIYRWEIMVADGGGYQIEPM